MKMNLFIFIVISIYFIGSLCQAAAHFLPDEEVQVFESIVEINGIRYHAVEYQGGIYYLKLMDTQKNIQELSQYCRQAPIHIFADDRSVPVATLESKETQVSELFIESLRRHCAPLTNLDELAVGFSLTAQKPNTKLPPTLHYNPLEDLLGFQSDF